MAAGVMHGQEQYSITVSADPTNGGTVSGGGMYLYGETCTVTANPNTGWTFANWTENGSVVAAYQHYSFIVTCNRTLVAHFQQSINLPTVTTNPVTNITQTSATCGGNVTSDGGANVTARGVCWSTNPNPTIGNAHTSDGTGTGTFISSITGLSPNTTYYVRAYATNSAGTAYGNEVSFTTSQPSVVPPSVTTNQVSNIQQTSATGSGTVTSDGGATVTQRGVCWSTSHNPTTSGNHAQASSGGIGAFTLNMTNLTPGTTYYVRAYATNSAGTAYGNEVSFTTQQVQSYIITVSANPSNGGTVTGGGTYQQGQQCTVTATAITGYTFLRWTENGTAVSTSTNYSFTVTSNRALVAHFQQLSYAITTNVSPAGAGTVTGGGAYHYGETCTLHATANNGYEFQSWNDGNTQNPRSIIVTGNATYTAIFSQSGSTTYTITTNVSPVGSGTVTGAGSYPEGATCTLHATANNGYEFLYWKKGNTQVSSNATYSFTVNASTAGNYTAYFQQSAPTQYTIIVNANPSNGGTVTGGGTYQQGQSCTVHATASSGFAFTNWTENGSVVSTNANYTFTVTGNRTLVANFTRRYTINVSANPSNGGTVTGGGNYNQGASCTVTATANTGFTFTNWTENGAIVSTETTYQFQVTSNRNLVANFTEQLLIEVSANPTNGGTATGGGTFNNGESCTVVATAADGYTFENWTEDGYEVSTDANYTFIVNRSRRLTANFILLPPNTFTINVSPNPFDGGTATGGGAYQQGQQITVTATANPGYKFEKWTESDEIVSTEANYTFLVERNRTLVAQFQLRSYTITAIADPEEGGIVTGGGEYAFGAICTLSATPNPGYTFTKWKQGNATVSTNPTYIFQVTGDASFTAIFTPIQQYTITARSNNDNWGTVSGDGQYYAGVTCTLHAMPNTGYRFDNWKMNGAVVSEEPDYTFVVTSNATYTAYFRETSGATYTITTEVTPEGSGTVTGGGQYNAGSSVTLTANANEGYTFAHWQDGETDNPRTITVNGNATYTAFFQQSGPTQYNITVNANPSEGGSANGGGTFVSGESCTVQASPNEGFVFVNWTEDDRQVSSSTFYTFDVTSDRTLVANFADENACIIYVNILPEGGGTTTGAGPYTPGQACTLKAYPKPGYNFINWTKDNEVVSENPNYTFEVTETSRYVAHFNRSGYVISASANPAEGGSVTGSGIYVQGMHLNLTATANEGYCFVNWSENGVIQCLTEQYEIVVERDRTLVANFEQLPVYTISATAETNGSIDPQGDVQVVKGSSITFNIKPDFGFRITAVTVDGNNIGRDDTYTFNDVDRNHTIFVSFNGWDVEEYNATKAQVYPNPAKDRVFVDGDGLAVVSLCDLLGNCLRSMDGDISHEMNLSGLSEGLYVLMIKTKDGHIGYQKLVITK